MKILIADDHAIVRTGLWNLLRGRPGWEVCGEASNGEEALAEAERHHPDVVVLDIMMPPGLSGVAAARAIRARLPRTEVLVFTMHDTEEVLADVLSSGARGCVLKTDPSRYLLAAIDALGHHAPFVTPSLSDAFVQAVGRRSRPHGLSPLLLTGREREVVRLLADGRSNRQVADTLGISVKTVESHRANVMRKLELRSIVDLVRYAVRNQLVEA
jgi:DNA-binding NarL/FixJ family response regulator